VSQAPDELVAQTVAGHDRIDVERRGDAEHVEVGHVLLASCVDERVALLFVLDLGDAIGEDGVAAGSGPMIAIFAVGSAMIASGSNVAPDIAR
jgi:hypothetical protein